MRMISLVIVGLAACRSGSAPSTGGTAAGSGVVVGAGSAVAGTSNLDAGGIADSPTDAPVGAGVTVVHPLAMTGPYSSAREGCEQAKPCGFTQIDDKGREVSPARTTRCNGIVGDSDLNGIDPYAFDSRRSRLAHRANGLDIRIASQHCAVPGAVARSDDRYFVLVHRADGWWRSAPIWWWSSEQRCTGDIEMRWNDQPGRTVGRAAVRKDCFECNEEAFAKSTLELLLRVEAGERTPIVFPPLVVGERESTELVNPGTKTACRLMHREVLLRQHWGSADDLELTGAATWETVQTVDGLIAVGLIGATGPSAIGRYQFVRP